MPDVECTGVGFHIVDRSRNEQVGVGIAIAVGVRGKIVGEQEIANSDVLRDRLPVIAGHAGREILWSFHSTGSRL